MATTRNKRVPMQEQIKLINECRKSGLTDADWCRENGIAPSTFYNWVNILVPHENIQAEHKYDAGVVIKEPTTTENGVKTYTCKVCEGTKTESIPRLLRIIYNANGGSGAPDTQVKIQNQLLVLSSKKPTKTYNANVENIANVSKNITCTFKNWNTQANGSGTNYNSGESYTGNQDLTLYAQWENPEIGTLPIPNRPDYIFDGWYTELNGENRVTPPTVITGDMILYAHWTADVPQDPIEAFVARLYKKILGRKADPSGLKAWSDVLKSGKEQGAKVAQGFVDSEELKKRNLSDDAYTCTVSDIL